MDQPHLYIGYHDEHGFVAASGPRLSEHLADWLLTRTLFVRVPGSDLYRLAEPRQDGKRRTRQAVKDIRAIGFTVQADYQLDPALTPDPPPPARSNGLLERRAGLAQAASVRSPQLVPALAAAPGATAVRTPVPAAPPSPGRARGRGAR